MLFTPPPPRVATLPPVERLGARPWVVPNKLRTKGDKLKDSVFSETCCPLRADMRMTPPVSSSTVLGVIVQTWFSEVVMAVPYAIVLVWSGESQAGVRF